jgi:hypothetical protein
MRQILVFCYHKSGTVLFGNVLRRICDRLGLVMQERYGLVPAIDPAADVVLLAHSLLGRLPERPFRGVRIVRDPRDIWVSGYLYHRHCEEPWCIAAALDAVPPIGFPAVPMAFVHRRERWKRGWVERLGGRSYQANLLGRDREAGLDFELAGYAGATFEDMAAWPNPGIPDVKMEQIAGDFDGAMAGVLRQLGFAEALLPELVALAGAEDLARMDDARLAASPHIHGRRISKWREMLTAEQAGAFGRRYASLLAGLGYPAD